MCTLRHDLSGPMRSLILGFDCIRNITGENYDPLLEKNSIMKVITVTNNHV